MQGHKDEHGKDRGWYLEEAGGFGTTSSQVTKQEAAHIGLMEGWWHACICHRLMFLREPEVESMCVCVGGRSCAPYIQFLPPRGN